MLKNVTLENVMYAAVKNDIAYVIGDKLIVLLEHQSTINQNMPLRCLLYIAREYEKILDAKQRYARLLQKIPTPEFFVLYNGTEDYPLKTQLKLSDAFEVEKRSSCLELMVTVFNINADKNCELLNECTYLKEYSVFVETVRKYLAADKENGFTGAIKDCIGKGILKEYLTRKSREVMNMLVCDYDYATVNFGTSYRASLAGRLLLTQEIAFYSAVSHCVTKRRKSAYSQTDVCSSLIFKGRI